MCQRPARPERGEQPCNGALRGGAKPHAERQRRPRHPGALARRIQRELPGAVEQRQGEQSTAQAEELIALAAFGNQRLEVESLAAHASVQDAIAGGEQRRAGLLGSRQQARQQITGRGVGPEYVEAQAILPRVGTQQEPGPSIQRNRQSDTGIAAVVVQTFEGA